MSTLPTLFISHGSPMLALDAGLTGQAWARIAASLPRPRAIVVASAHWLTRQAAVSTTAAPTTIHDFHGFPQPLFALRYEPPGAPALARDAADLLVQAGFDTAIDTDRGLDHGAWVPLGNMYPEAAIPTFQLAIQPQASPEHHWRMGLALSSLRHEGVLVIGSGSLTHNLRELVWDIPENDAAHDYVPAFRDWVADRVQAGDIAGLLDYRQQAPGAHRAHPTDEHWLPFYVALGAAGEHSRSERIHSGITHGGLVMDVYQFS
ncbi:dioxygenase [Chitinimonas sp. BJYL2]|uniref:dioxygenase family protein n=1 Tax=Chitinimonas sp. BJYL2 TaxID=2976696 RepID=UPI0022B2D939|nr:class III extradiol ring-cleavage dioxygenase [Chitinimonas sp. BJYL2]